jgi:tripartite-type tricarboxylate transporter receptor subunit TctC
MQLPDVKEKLVAFGLIVQNEPPEFFAETIKSDFEKYGALIKKIGLQPK